jgi:hypothetical protein
MRKQLVATHPSFIQRSLALSLAGLLAASACTISDLGSAIPSGASPPTVTAGPATTDEPPATVLDAIQTTVPIRPAVDPAADPFKVSPPVTCDPALDGSSEPDYVALAELPVEGSELIPGVTNVALKFTSKAEQPFDIVVSGANEQVVSDYIKDGGVCLEAVPIAEPPRVSAPVLLDVVLVDTALEMTGASRRDLAANRDQRLADGLEGSLADVLADLGFAEGEAVARALERATAEVANAVQDGRISQQDADATDVAMLLDQLLHQPSAPFLTDPALVAEDEDAWADLIRRDPERTVVVTFVSQPRNRGEQPFDVVWFAVDPPINYKQNRYYRAICSGWAGVRLSVSAGRASLSFWRYTPYEVLGSQSDAAGLAGPDWLWESSAEQTTWDVGVTGWRDNSYYSLYGGWTEGTGGFCS